MSGDLHNQPDLIGDVDLWGDDPALSGYASRSGADRTQLMKTGQAWGQVDLRDTGRMAERHLPELRLFDRGGRRIDEVEFHPAYHQLMTSGIEAGYASLPWDGGRHATHAALVYMMSQVEPGVCCPMTMTYAAVPALSADQDLASVWRPKILSRCYDPSVKPVVRKGGATIGMAMTERQGGSDVRSNETRAVRTEDGWLLTGHKWFCSAPMSDAFLTLAYTTEGLTCFLVPRWFETSRNAIRIDRLKNKLGNRANASAEIRYEGALAHQLGDEGEGVRTIIEMVHHTRLDTAIAPAGLMRAALAEAHHWVANRSAFDRLLIDQPLMRRVLADLILDWEGATALAFRVAYAFDDPEQRAFSRVAVALAKFLNNKICPPFIAEAMEILGGMGFVEDTPLPMLYREAPLNGIWEGSGNVICLDVLRTLAKSEEAATKLREELDAGLGGVRAYDAARKSHADRWDNGVSEAEARAFATETAQLLTASVLIRKAPSAVAESYAATRLQDATGPYGRSEQIDEDALIARLGGSV